MNIKELSISGVFEITLDTHEDERGFFARSFCEKTFRNHGLWSHFPQHNFSFNKTRGTVRGMHYQVSPHEEVKVVRCLKGAVDDVIVDIRPDSPSFGQKITIELSDERQNALYIPVGFAHGFQSLKDDTMVSYLMGAEYIPDSSAGFCWDDPAFDISWRLPVSVISQRDRTYRTFRTEV